MTKIYLEEIIPILQLAIGPVIVISGAGLLLLSMTNRFGRVIDRSRLLVQNEEYYLKNKHHVKEQLVVLKKRASMLQKAIIYVSICLLLDVILIIALFLCQLIKIEGILLISLLFIGCMTFLALALLYFIIDLNLSLSALDLETNIEKNCDIV